MDTEYVTIYNNCKLFNIKKEPFEQIEDTFKRAWFIVKNYNEYEYNELYSRSIIYKNKNMSY